MFKVIKKEGKARRGVFTCAHGGEVQTPVFMNVGTQAAIKGGVSAIDLKERLGWPHPHRQRRLSGILAVGAAEDQ